MNAPENESDRLLKAASEKQPGMTAELISFLKENKKWWLFPIILFIILFAVLVVLSASPLAPFIYQLF